MRKGLGVGYWSVVTRGETKSSGSSGIGKVQGMVRNEFWQFVNKNTSLSQDCEKQMSPGYTALFFFSQLVIDRLNRLEQSVTEISNRQRL